jgi:hypothetical protein
MHKGDEKNPEGNNALKANSPFKTFCLQKLINACRRGVR